MRFRLLHCLAALAPFLPCLASAEPALVDQVERLDVERGEAELEWQSIFASDTDDEESVVVHILSGEYALTERFSLGFELGAEDEDGEELSAEYLMLQAKLVAFDPDEAPVGLGVQASIGPSFSGGDGEAEVEILAETRLAGLVFAAAIAIEAPIDAIDDTVTRYAVRADWAQDWGAFGLEAGGDLDAAEDEAPRHWLGPLVAFEPIPALSLEFSYLHGLNDDTPDNQFRIQLGRAF